MREIADTADMADVENLANSTNNNASSNSNTNSASTSLVEASMETAVGSMTNHANNSDAASAASEAASNLTSVTSSSGISGMTDTASETSSAVTLETLSEDGNAPATFGASAATSNPGGHPLLTPTSPRSVTTASMSASGKRNHKSLYACLFSLWKVARKLIRMRRCFVSPSGSTRISQWFRLACSQMIILLFFRSRKLIARRSARGGKTARFYCHRFRCVSMWRTHFYFSATEHGGSLVQKIPAWCDVSVHMYVAWKGKHI